MAKLGNQAVIASMIKNNGWIITETILKKKERKII